MRENAIRARQKRPFQRTTDSIHSQPVAPNLVQRNFIVAASNQASVTGVNYVSTADGWLYLAAVLCLFLRHVVGWAASAFNDTDLALAALK